MYRVILKNDIVFSCSNDKKVKAWSVTSKKVKYEFAHGNTVYDIVIGREGTPLANRIFTISWDQTCRISNVQTGAEIKTIKLGHCWSIAVDKAQTMIAIGNGDRNVTFIETSNFTKVKKVSLDNSVYSLAFNKRNDCLLAVTGGEVHSFKFN